MIKGKAKLSLYCLALSALTVAAFHIPFFKHLLGCLEGGFNAVVLTVSAAVLLLALDFLLFYLLVGGLRLTRLATLIAATLLG